MAGVIDEIILSLPFFPLNVALSFRTLSFRTDSPLWLTLIAIAAAIGFYGIPEGLWGASLGKRTSWDCGSPRPTASPPGVLRTLWRAVLFQTPSYGRCVARACHRPEASARTRRGIAVACVRHGDVASGS